jgi:hypothetical protein
VIGPTTLAKFTDAAQLNAYIRAAMPFWKPGSLTEEDAWRVTAFILRQNNLWEDKDELGASNAADVKIPRSAFLTPVGTAQQPDVHQKSGISVWFIVVGVLGLIALTIFILKKSRNPTTI